MYAKVGARINVGSMHQKIAVKKPSATKESKEVLIEEEKVEDTNMLASM